ncbi:MAG: glucose/sorbosone dehydrogenase domain protein, partial [Pedosphaera sp.]|nr:glucose/sorbosone dehydrogenase domain protein [Pedosphaera sp.]
MEFDSPLHQLLLMNHLVRTVALFEISSLLWAASASAQTYGLDTRNQIGAFLNNKLPPVASVATGDWTVVNAFPNLTFQDPTFLTFEPGANRLYVCSREGYIWSFANDPNTTTKTLFLDLSAKTQGWDDCGLLGIAFHPEYGQAGSPNRGYVYVYYQFQMPGNIQGSATVRPPAATLAYNRLSRFTVPAGSSVADPNSEVILINLFDRHLWHNGGGMFFGADGFLYLSNGDEGGASDQYNQAQKINGSLFSGVLRIDVNKDPTKSHPIRRQPQDAASPPAGWPNSSTGNYYVPNDNPWQDANGNLLEEFWAIGVRSPHRMTYDPPTGQIWLGDVGQDVREEVDLIQKGHNYQWGYWEGTYPGAKPMPSPLIGIDTPPVYDYPHDQGDGCVIGGYVYRGARFSTDLGGKYIFGDNDSGRIWTLTYNGSS